MADLARRTIGEVLLAVANRFITLIALFVLVAGGVLIHVAWHLGPEAQIARAHYRAFTAREDARIVDSWLALELDTGSIVHPEFWRASALAARCAVVEYGADWGASRRRAFCGTRVGFNENYTLPDLADLSPGVPFAWARDERGFAVPEIRLDKPALAWLSTHAPSTSMHPRWPAKTVLDWLKIEEDRPVDAAIAGWTTRASPVMPVAFDPARPEDALPAEIVKLRSERDPPWFGVAIIAAMGLTIWFTGILLLPLFNSAAPWGRFVLGALLLCTVPWWTDRFPAAIAHFNLDLARMARDMFGDVDPTDRMIASAPEAATLVDGERLRWRLEDSVYAPTLGALSFVAPRTPYASGDAALDALAGSVAAQVHALDVADQAALYARLERDKRGDLLEAGIAFVPAARAALLDAATEPEVRKAARGFLTQWVIAPTATVDVHHPGSGAFIRINASLRDVPVPEIANLAQGARPR